MPITAVDKAEELGLSTERLARIAPFFQRRYIDTGKLAGITTVVARGGQVAHLATIGSSSREDDTPLTHESIFRIYSMTKPIVSVALLSLYEEGHFQLDDPVSRFIPAWANLRVWSDGTADLYSTTFPEREMQIRDLLTHTSGLTYGFMSRHPVDALYRRRGVERDGAATAAEMVERLSVLPLRFSPGTQWSYSVATDVCGYLCEVISGQPLDQFLEKRIFEPLGMVDTGFWVPPEKAHRLTANYAFTSGDPLVLFDAPASSTYLQRPTFLSGGGGLVSTASDYLSFALMLANRGELGGRRILGRKTVEHLSTNHLPGNSDLAGMGQRVFSEVSFEGIGFGLGVSVTIDPAKAGMMGSAGDHGWGGAASTAFWVDRSEDLVVLQLAQLMPSSTHPIRRELRSVVYQSLVD